MTKRIRLDEQTPKPFIIEPAHEKLNHEKLRVTCYDLLRELRKQIRQFEKDLRLSFKRHSDELRLSSKKYLTENASSIRVLSKKAQLATEKFMDRMEVAHSDEFVTEKMSQFLNLCENLCYDIPRCIEETPKPTKHILRTCEILLNDLKHTVKQIKEQQMAEKGKAVRWSVH